MASPLIIQLEAVSDGPKGLAVETASLGLYFAAQLEHGVPAKVGGLVLRPLLCLPHLLRNILQLRTSWSMVVSRMKT